MKIGHQNANYYILFDTFFSKGGKLFFEIVFTPDLIIAHDVNFAQGVPIDFIRK